MIIGRIKYVSFFFWLLEPKNWKIQEYKNIHFNFRTKKTKSVCELYSLIFGAKIQILEHLMYHYERAKSKGVIPFTSWALKLMLKLRNGLFIIKLSFCASDMELLGTQEYSVDGANCDCLALIENKHNTFYWGHDCTRACLVYSHGGLRPEGAVFFVPFFILYLTVLTRVSITRESHNSIFDIFGMKQYQKANLIEKGFIFDPITT